MLYLALPPAPPAIAITLPAQQVAGKTLTEEISASSKPTKINSAGQPLVCTSPQAPKSDLVSNLLGKMLATSASTKGQTLACISQKKKSVTLSLQTQLNKTKQVKGFSASTPQNPVNANIEVASTSTDENNSPAANSLDNAKSVTVSASKDVDANSGDKQDQKLTSSLSYEKTGEKNAIGKILATVQELISISLYAYINNSITDVIRPNSEIEINNQNPQKTAIAISPETNSKQKIEENSSNTSRQEIASNNLGTAKILEVIQELITISIYASLNNSIDPVKPNIESLQKIAVSEPTIHQKPEKITDDNQKIATNNNTINQRNNFNANTLRDRLRNQPILQLAKTPGEPFLVGVVINGKEVGTLDIIQEENALLIPLESFAEIAGFTVEKTGEIIQVKTPLGLVKIQPDSLKQINGVSYISKVVIQKELSINIDLNTADLTLLTDLPWRGGSGQSRPRSAKLKPDFFAPSSGLSTFKQELNITTGGENTNLNSSTLLGGRILGGAWRLRLDNNFVDQPDISEYFFYKRSGRFRYQIGRQQIGLHPLLSGMDLTGLQFGYSNLPEESFSTSYSANELLPRRSRPVQTFSGQAPPASFVQLTVAGVVVAQQQVGFNGVYEFLDVNLPVGQSNEIELLIYDRNNLRVPKEIRSVRISASDLLLPAGGNVQLGGLGFSGNLAQNTLFGESNNNAGKAVGFYQLRQGLSNNLTFEGSVQAAPGGLQSQAGLVWRLANPIILSASVGSSEDKVGYVADLDVQLDRLEINANSQTLPQVYKNNTNSISRFNHSLELKYRFSNRFNLGFIARSRQDNSSYVNYIVPTFSVRPFSTLSLSGRPDIDGRYLFNAFFQPNNSTRLSFNTYGDAYISDLSYNLGNDYQLSFGNEFGGNSAPRYSLSVGHNPSSLRELGWNLGLALRDGEVAPTASASMQVLPGLLARLEYQGIPSRSRGFGGFGDDRFTVSLVSDLSFGAGRITTASYGGIGKERGAIAGRLVVQGERKGFDLSGSNIRVLDKRNQTIGAARSDSSGNFFIGNLPEGNYIVELEPNELPIELSVPKTSQVVEVANSAVTKLDFAVRAEYGVAGRITDVANQPIEKVRVELINSTTGIRALSAVTDQYGLYRLDGVPVGKYTLRVSPQDSLNPNDTLPKRQVEIKSEFVYNQNLQLPISAAAKRK
jgi:Carboxypeptidase regulatory-like domain